jgi:hypothetical protein
MTEDYPEAFEIQCSCGYSLLVPEMASEILSPGLESEAFASLPGAVEAQDEAAKISIDKELMDPLMNIPKVDDSLTPPEELPNEMPYDPFELQQSQANNSIEENPLEESSAETDAVTKAIDLAVAQKPNEEFNSETQNASESLDGPEESIFSDMVFAQSTRSVNQSVPAEDEFQNNSDAILQANESQEVKNESTKDSSPSIEERALGESPEIAPAQQIIQRAQLASMGQLLGSSYNLKWADLNKDKALELQKRCEQIVVPRPWLAAEIKRRGIDLEKLSHKVELDNVPELLALEIFMAAYELGGSCEFSQI